MKPRIGFMGQGIMGTPMSANLMRAGYSVTVYNRNQAKAGPVKQMGAGALKLAQNPRFEYAPR